jgi:nitrate reductase molybdenum cofactor assembly chaperone NarJ/NarW
MKTYRALSALLSYPEPALLEALPEIADTLRSAGVDEVAELLRELKGDSLYALQERYVSLFDRSRALSLHLFEHVHGESRDRGQAMVDLQAMYASRRMRIIDNELPDYLPAFLEFLSLVSAEEAKSLLSETTHILRSLGNRLAERGSRYAGVFAALLALAGEAGLTKPLRATTDSSENLVSLDKEWMDPEVTFGGPQPVRFYRKGIPA